MSLINDIKASASKNGTKIQTAKSRDIESKLNQLLFLEKDIKGECKFIKSVMTRGMKSQERFGLHASAIIGSYGTFCLRQQVLSLFYKMQQGEQIPVKLKRIFEEGNAIHEKWQRMFIRGGYSDYSKLDISQMCEMYDLSFTPDIICTIPDENGEPEELVCEIKSVNTFQFQKMTSHASARKQLQLYMYLTGIHKGFVLCEDKNTQDIKVYYYDFDISEIEEIISRLEQVQLAKMTLESKKKMTPRHIKCTDSKCKMAEACNMRDACYNVGMGRIRL